MPGTPVIYVRGACNLQCQCPIDGGTPTGCSSSLEMPVLMLTWGLQPHTYAAHQGWFAAVCQEDQAGIIPSANGAGHPGEAGTVPDSQMMLLRKHMVHQMGQLIVAKGLHLGVVLRIGTPRRPSALLCQVLYAGKSKSFGGCRHRQNEGNGGCVVLKSSHREQVAKYFASYAMICYVV